MDRCAPPTAQGQTVAHSCCCLHVCTPRSHLLLSSACRCMNICEHEAARTRATSSPSADRTAVFQRFNIGVCAENGSCLLQVHTFEKPWFTSAEGAMGCALCIIPFFWLRKRRCAAQQSHCPSQATGTDASVLCAACSAQPNEMITVTVWRPSKRLQRPLQMHTLRPTGESKCKTCAVRAAPEKRTSEGRDTSKPTTAAFLCVVATKMQCHW